jgi:outer membrane protease
MSAAMQSFRHRRILAGLALAAFAFGPADAADLWNDNAGALLRTETISAEVNAGYLTGTSKEYVYDTSISNHPKLSQLTWSLGNALAVGGRFAIKPLDWLTIRARGWSTVTSDGSMRDYDWLAGYGGFQSFTHYSYSPDTVAAKAWQADVSLAAAFYQDDELALTAIAGFRHLTTKWNAKGGSYNYSVNAFRDTSGEFQGGQLGVAYQQWWDTPYLGLGVAYNVDDWTVSAEAIGSPIVMGRAQDHHNLRDLVIKDSFQPANMGAVSAGLEYRLMPGVSLAGRVEYQRYFDAKGDGRYAYGPTKTDAGYSFIIPKGAGAEADNLLLSLGVKARL